MANPVVALAFEKKHERRVLATRTLGGATAVAVDAGAERELHGACRRAASEVGPAPYLYAQKHHRPAMEIMGEVERVLWPESDNVPAEWPRMDKAASNAALFRTFRYMVKAERFVAGWAHAGPAHLVDVLAALDDFDVALAWGSEPIVHIDVEEKASSPLIGGRGTMFSTPGEVAELPLARAMRPLLVAAPADVYAQAVKRARAAHARPGMAIWQRAALAFILPDERDLTVPVVEALLAIAPAEGRESTARTEWLRWLLTVPLPPELALRVLDALDGNLTCLVGRDETPIYTWLSLAAREGGLDELHDRLLERMRTHLAGRGWSAARSLAAGLAVLRSEAIVQLFVDYAAHKALEKIAPPYFERFLESSYPKLLAASAGPGPGKGNGKGKQAKHIKRAAELVDLFAQKHPDAVASAAPAKAKTKTKAGSAEEPATPPAIAREGEIPPILVSPPWQGKKAPKRPAPAKDVAALSYDEHVDFEHGELEAWTEAARKMPWFRDGKDTRVWAAGLAPTTIAYNLHHPLARRIDLAVRGAGAIDHLVMYATHSPERGLAPLSRVGSPRLALPVARSMVERDGTFRADAQVVLARHPRAAAIGLVPAAAEGDAAAREGLRFLVLTGEAAVVREVIAASGAEAARALGDIVALEPQDVFQQGTTKLPAFFVAKGLPAPILAASGHALPPPAVEALGALLRSTEPIFHHPGIAAVRAACTPESLDAFAWALEKQWEFAKSPEAQRFALYAIGFLGSESLLERLADEIEALLKKQRVMPASALLHAFAASPLPLGAAILARFAARGSSDRIGHIAEKWLDLVSAVRGASPAEPSLYFSTGRASADMRRRIVQRLEVAMTRGDRFELSAFVERVLEHAQGREIAAGLVVSLLDAKGKLVAMAQPAPKASGVAWTSSTGDVVDVRDVASVEIAHPLAIDAAGATMRGAFRSAFAAAGIAQPFLQLERPTFGALAQWPKLRGTVVPYRKLERLTDQRGWRLYRTHCGSPLHDWSYLQRTSDRGAVRLSIGFNFGKHLGDSVLGEVIGQDEDGTPGIRHGMRATPEGLSAVAMSELQLDIASLTG